VDGILRWSSSQALTTNYCNVWACMRAWLLCLVLFIALHRGNEVQFYQLLSLIVQIPVNSCNVTRTGWSRSVLETVSFREMILTQISAKLGRKPMTSSVAGEFVSYSATVDQCCVRQGQTQQKTVNALLYAANIMWGYKLCSEIIVARLINRFL